ncbi:NAD(P)/FAD-dependent oxidoreductase [Streptomyces plumbiresistens]|uniref:FAD-dependent oxidoreductase n=1 Tax=Streptomyces plumbiresistens TaxID=511811 RepID=A0ABP7SK75_9ACTN
MNASRLVVVGASCAGTTAAETLRRSGWQGEIVLLGDEEGLPYDRPPLSKSFLGDPLGTNVSLRTADAFVDLDVRYLPGVTAIGLDVGTRTVVTTSGTFESDGVVVATGVRARRLGWLGDDPRVRYLRTAHDATLLSRDLTERRGSLAVLGGGPLGLEAAASAAGLGWDVQVIEAGPQVMPAMLGPGLAERVVAHHLGRGIDIRTSVLASGLDASGLSLSTGERLDVDLILVAVGAVPNSEWLEGTAGLTVDNGVVCDAYGEAAPLVYAAGDVARWMHPDYRRLVRLESRTNAVRQAVTSARNLVAALSGAPDERSQHAPEPFFWSDQGELRLKAYGDVGGADRTDVDGGAGAGLTLFGGDGDVLVGFASQGASMNVVSDLRSAMATRRSISDVVNDLSDFAVSPPLRRREVAA